MRLFENLKPLGDMMLLRIDPTEEKTSGGIILPQQTKSRQDAMQAIGTVVAMGPLAFGDCGGPEAWGVKVGDRVFFNKNPAISVPSDDEEEKLYRFCHDQDVLACLGVSHGA